MALSAILGLLLFAELPAVLATVNGHPVTREEIEMRMAQSRAMDPERFDRMSAAERGASFQRIVNALVVRKIELLEAARLEIRVADAEVHRLFEDEARRNGGTAAFSDMLQRAGSSAREWKREMREVLTIRKLEESLLGFGRDPAERGKWLEGLRRKATVWVWAPE